MIRATDGDFLALLAAAAPGFVRAGPVRRTIKSHWCVGAYEGAPAVAKCVTHEDPIWRWYFERELALYEAFARTPPPVRAPRLLCSEPRASLLVLERLAGPPLATRRYPDAPLDDEATARELASVVRALASFAEGTSLAPSAPVPAPHLGRFRARLLEDPTAPLAWALEGLALCARDRVLSERSHTLVAEELAHDPRTSFAHGDLLLRNVLRDDGSLALVDWECAGPYLAHWDAALVWAGLGPAGRAHFERALFDGAPAPPAFLACLGFALARELRLQRIAFRAASDAPRVRDLDEALERTVYRLA